MKPHLLDTNICIYYMKGQYKLDEQFKIVGHESLYISEITLGELKFGVANSQQRTKNQKTLEKFLSDIVVLPIIDVLDFYAEEKARLMKSGNLIDDFDLLIGSTAVVHEMTMVTNNETHFERINGIKIKNWVK